MSRKAFVVTAKHDNGCSVDNKQAICLAYDAQSAAELVKQALSSGYDEFAEILSVREVEPNEVIVGMHTVVYEG